MIRAVSRLVGRHYLRIRLSRQLRKAGMPIAGLRLVDARKGPSHHLELSKGDRSIDIAIDFRSVLDNPELARVFRHRGAAIIDPFVRSKASVAVGNISDGEESGPGTVVFSATARDAILVPDAVFYASRGYASYRRACESWRTDWAARKEKIVWRGTTTGHGRIASAEMAPGDDSLIQRTRMCLALREIPGVDAKFASLAQSVESERDRRQLEQAGILGGRIDPRTWIIRKFAIDIDGNSNAWSNLFTRLLAGCCVIKIESPFGFRQWYYDALLPWQHYVPVQADLSDLREKIDWCRAHDQQCSEIAAAGRDFAVHRDFDTEMKRAVETLDSRLCSG